MATIETKYSIGDAVWYASTTTERRQHPCPDCLGSKKWKCVSPAGGEFETSCPRCVGYQSDRSLSLDYTAYAPVVRRLTIGSVQFNSAPGSYDSGSRYMCVETGVGSGSVYDEDRLFLTEAAAVAAAEAMAAEQNSTTEWVVKQFNRSLELSDYQLDSLRLRVAKEQESRAALMVWDVGSLLNEIREADDKEAILEAVESYENYDWARDKQKLLALRDWINSVSVAEPV